MKYSGLMFLFAFLFFACFPQLEIAGSGDASISSVQRFVPNTSVAFELSSGLRFFNKADRFQSDYTVVKEFTLENPEIEYGHLDPLSYRHQSLCEFNWSQSRAPPAFIA
ncbi:hypothetical protein [Bdellovibrio sp. HCB209]|uniref:hypothetical protein n=1 Tax=Bdellovibrio sp. HCB209 TaxID=3394354 RepID=UPI0039B38FE4